jgi:hypothetical protein
MYNSESKKDITKSLVYTLEKGGYLIDIRNEKIKNVLDE